jgi:hypothetical protein
VVDVLSTLVVALICPVDMSMSNIGKHGSQDPGLRHALLTADEHELGVCFSFGQKLVISVFEFEISEGLIQIYFLVYAYAKSLPLSGRPASTACSACDRSTPQPA